MKYHVFVGSALDDLKSERRELPRIVMELGHIPVMADFLDGGARNASKLLQRTVEECDYLLAVVAHRYRAADGRVLPLIEECAIAARKGIPILALVIDGKARWKAARRDTDEDAVRRLDEFKSALRDGPFETWATAAELCQKAQTMLVQEFALKAKPGWVRQDRVVDPIIANEIARLSFENDELRRLVPHEASLAPATVAALPAVIAAPPSAALRDEHEHALKVLALNRVTLSFYYNPGGTWENARQFRLLRVFRVLAPELVQGKTTGEVSRFLGTVLNPDLARTVRKDYPTPSNSVKKIMADLLALGLVWCAPGGDGGEVWETSDRGRELFSADRMRHLDRALER